MKTLATRNFTKAFAKYRREPCLVTDRGRVLGTWTPVAGQPKPVDFLKRLKHDFTQPLPFTGAQLLAESTMR